MCFRISRAQSAENNAASTPENGVNTVWQPHSLSRMGGPSGETRCRYSQSSPTVSYRSARVVVDPEGWLRRQRLVGRCG